jgi:small-conductance mechanosensitive channel
MTLREEKVPLFARRLAGSVAILALAAGAALLLPRLGVPLVLRRTDPATGLSVEQDWGRVAVGVALAYFVARLLDYLIFDVLYRLRRKAPVPALLRQLIGLIVFGIGVSAVLKVVFSTSLAPLLTTSAVLTAVIGLALQDTLGNLFAGIALHLEKTVQEGDLVRAGETVGIVEELSWRAIKLRTLDGNVLLVPNSVAGREKLEVYPRIGPPIARSMRVGLEYETAPSRARQALEGALVGMPGLARSPAPVSYLKSFDDSSIHYELRYWLEDYAKFLEIDSRARERVWYAVDRAGLRFAYPVIRQHQYAAGPLPQRAPYDPAPLLRSVDLFAPLSDAERAQLAAGARERRYGPDETVVREGESGTSMFLVESGRLSVSIHAAAGASQKVTVLDPGSAFGEISLLTGEPRMATVRALEEVKLMEIDKTTLAPILAANPSLVQSLEATMAERRRGTGELLDAAQAALMAAPEAVPLGVRIARFFGLA